MRYWATVFAVVGIVAAALPIGRVVHGIVGDAQIVFALLLIAVLGWLVLYER